MSQQSVYQTTDHWWWRPGWLLSRTFYTWHLTFGDQPAIPRRAATYRRALQGIPGWDLVPDRWLHLTMQGLGFTDEVSPRDVDAIVAEARVRLADVEALTLELDQPTFTSEAIRWDPTGQVFQVRDAIREAIGTVWGEVPEPADGFTGHVTIAYSNRNGDASDAVAALETVPQQSVVANIERAQLIILNRDQHMYEWKDYATVALAR